ncbi:hypothetical protein ARMSODRAFT_982672 [Armillaria solidipes]|uniref:Uncharacterized protein n=1 Tax=Armillaria solidipes TaxID=1076256 RepID=A0A2H3AT15_9AGAR|nr:hypothetical protein ARMSODRAFT_982672 [Armillaria solidipes]
MCGGGFSDFMRTWASERLLGGSFLMSPQRMIVVFPSKETTVLSSTGIILPTQCMTVLSASPSDRAEQEAVSATVDVLDSQKSSSMETPTSSSAVGSDAPIVYPGLSNSQSYQTVSRPIMSASTQKTASQGGRDLVKCPSNNSVNAEDATVRIRRLFFGYSVKDDDIIKYPLDTSSISLS